VFGISDLFYTYSGSRIPDPGVKKAPDPGSGSATLIFTLSILLQQTKTIKKVKRSKQFAVFHLLIEQLPITVILLYLLYCLHSIISEIAYYCNFAVQAKVCVSWSVCGTHSGMGNT
jgi:hypothetical protein